MSREERPRAKPRRPRVSEQAAAALENRIAASEAAPLPPLPTPSNVPTLERSDVQTTTGDSEPIVRMGPGIIERPGRITSDGRKGARTLRRMTVYVPPELAQRLDRRSLETGKDRSSLITEAVMAYLGI